MRLAELSSRSGYPAATIKYYLRTGLLRPGAAEAGSTWARYDEDHLRRLRLVRALTEVAGLSLDEVRGVLDAVDASGSQHQARGAVQHALAGSPPVPPSEEALARVDDLLTRHGWALAADNPHRARLAAALDTLEELEFHASDEALDAYAAALEEVAEREVPRVADEADPIVAAERLVVGTLLYEPVLTVLRRMAHEVVSARR